MEISCFLEVLVLKLEELYITLRQYYREVPNEEQITVTLQDLADRLFYTVRNTRVLIQKLDSLQWITWVSGKGRGNHSSITFHKTLEEAQLEYYKSMILDGKENEAFIRVDTEAPAIKMDLSDWYYQSKFLVHYDPSINRVHIRLRELITKDNVELYSQLIKENLEKTSPDYTILMDMTDEQVNTPDVEDQMIELRQLVIDKELKGIATYTSSDHLKTYMKSRLDEMGDNKTFLTREKAEAFLNEL